MHRPGLPQDTHWLRRLTEALITQVFPPACALCAEPGAQLCAACNRQLDEALRHVCRQCSISLPHSAAALNICGTCLRERPAYDRSIAAAAYLPPFDQLVIGLKYRAQLAWAPLFAARLAQRISATCAADDGMPDILMAVPLSRERLAMRGYNQAMEIARPLGRRLGIPVISAALRIRDTPAQASLPFEARRKNIRNAFYLPQDSADCVRLSGLRVGVVDDVMTTGSTLHELARILKQAGAREVINLVAARTPKS